MRMAQLGYILGYEKLSPLFPITGAYVGTSPEKQHSSLLLAHNIEEHILTTPFCRADCSTECSQHR